MKKAKEKEEKDREALEEKRRQEEAEKWVILIVLDPFTVENFDRQKEENLKTQKEIRRHVREEKRKAKIMKKLEITGSDEINAKIANEKKKLVKVQRKLEAIRLVEELFKRVKVWLNFTKQLLTTLFTFVSQDKHSADVQRYDVPDKRAEEVS